MVDELVTSRAAPGLRGDIRGYWGYHHTTPGRGRQREPLSTGVVLIFGLGPELGIVDRAHPERPAAGFGSFVAGLDDWCTVIEHEGEMHGLQVDLSPLAAGIIFGEPMHTLAREVVRLEDLLGAEAGLLEERIWDCVDWSERFAVVDGFLAGRLARGRRPAADVDWAWRRLVASGGATRITDLAGELGCTRKHLATRFREHVGLPPKLVGRMLRFRGAIDLLGEPGASLAGVAAGCGYYDQSHLVRDFRDFAGASPTEYLADRVTFVQDTGVVRA
ncbi:MAG TPA: helix-turn-helix domain-containing protein [Solirubrobacteraceae bacterium]|nr:helix-turn-helix domain-containing protein [Solirubrobacteraceae bacterium]